MQFRDIPGQEKQSRQFLQAAGRGRVPHALLVSARPGTGGLAFGLAVARWILCVGEKEEDACGECLSCRKISSLSHPDFHITFPFYGSKVTSGQFVNPFREAVADNPFLYIRDWMRRIEGETSNPNINVKECEKIIHDLSLKSFESSKKVYLIWLAEYLGKQGNRLLKLIEEPTPDTHLILVTEQVERILPTILSRCQLIRLDRLDDGDVAEYLQREKGISPEAANRAAMMADGDINRALDLAEQPDETMPALWFQWILRTSKSQIPGMAQLAEDLAKLNKEQQIRFLEYGTHFLQEVTRYLWSGEEDLRLTEKNTHLAKRMSGIMNVDFLDELRLALEEGIYQLGRNAHPRIMFMDLAIRTKDLFAGVLKNKAHKVR